MEQNFKQLLCLLCFKPNIPQTSCSGHWHITFTRKFPWGYKELSSENKLIQKAKIKPLTLILGFLPWRWRSPHHFHKEQRKYPLKVAWRCWHRHTAVECFFANPHPNKQGDWSGKDCWSYPRAFLLASGLNYFYACVSMCSLLSASVTSTDGSGLCFLCASTTPPGMA